MNLFNQLPWSSKHVSSVITVVGLTSKKSHIVFNHTPFFIVLEFLNWSSDITSAVGLCLEKTSKEELETTKDVLHSILQGVSCTILQLYQRFLMKPIYEFHNYELYHSYLQVG